MSRSASKGVEHLKTLKQLEWLDVRGTQIVTGVTALRGLPKLRVVYTNLLWFDPQAKTKLAECRKALPRATIHPAYPGIPLGQNTPFGIPGGGGIRGLPGQ